MRFKSKESNAEELQLNMTAMIDIVFQLLVFFIMTFKVTAQEADFNIRMPSVSTEQAITDIEPVVINVGLKANSERNLARIEASINGLGGTNFTGDDKYKQLTKYVETTLARESDPSSEDEVEVEFDIDKPLRYRYTVQAIEAVFGRVEDGEVVKLVQKIKFRPKK